MTKAESDERVAGAMILTCPACRTRYRVDDQALGGPAGRTVRCASCGHTWSQAPPAIEIRRSEAAARFDAPRIEPPLEVPLRPGLMAEPVPVPQRHRHGWVAVGFLMLIALLILALLAGIIAREEVVAMWPPAGRLYALVGLPVAPAGAGLEVGKVAPSRAAGGLIVDGEIINTGSTARDMPRLRVALRDAADKEVQFKIIDPPKARLLPGEVAHFQTPFEHPNDAATGVVVTFAPR